MLGDSRPARPGIDHGRTEFSMQCSLNQEDSPESVRVGCCIIAPMRLRIARVMVVLLVLLPSLVIWIWGLLPVEYAHRSMTVRPADLSVSPPLVGVPESQTKYAIAPAAEKGFLQLDSSYAGGSILELSWPARLRLSDPGRIVLAMHAEGGDPSQEQAPAESAQGAPYHLLVETNLVISGLQAVPVGEIAEPMQPGQPVKFYWSVRPDRQGAYPGVVWVHLRFIPAGGDSAAGQNEQIRRPLTAQRIEIETQDLFGLGGPQARALGSIGVVLACFLGLEPVFVHVWRRLRYKPDSIDA